MYMLRPKIGAPYVEIDPWWFLLYIHAYPSLKCAFLKVNIGHLHNFHYVGRLWVSLQESIRYFTRTPNIASSTMSHPLHYLMYSCNTSFVINPSTINEMFKVVNIKKSIWVRTMLRGWSYRPNLAASVNNSNCNSVKSGEPTSISQHHLQQFHV